MDSKVSDVDSIVEESSVLVDSALIDLSDFAAMNQSNIGRKRNASNDEPGENVVIRSSTPVPDQTIDDLCVIEQIDRVVASVDSNLRAAGIQMVEVTEPARPTTNENEIEVIDLCETGDSAAELPIVVDLCTPSREIARPRRRSVNRRIQRCGNMPVPLPIPLPPIHPHCCIMEAGVLTVTTRHFCEQVNRSNTNETDDNGTGSLLNCPICLNSPQLNQPTSTKCGHVFCRQCILQAVRFNRKCPICNAKASEKTLIRLYL